MRSGGSPALTREVLLRREQWVYRGASRPAFAVAPGAGQESVWDYPRPPRIEPDARRVVVCLAGVVLADTTRTVRVLETASPPTFYLPRACVRMSELVQNETRSACEWKGIAVGIDLVDGPRDVGWCYPQTHPDFEAIRGWIAFYPSRIDCFVDGEKVRPQPGGYYGGWITDEIVGPWKGERIADGL